MSFDNLNRLPRRVQVELPRDSSGYVGRECPLDACLGYFKIKPGTGLQGSSLPCRFPYCGHAAGHDQFATKEQIEYMKSIVHRQVVEALRKDLKFLEFDIKPKGPFGIGISRKLQPGTPIPLKRYRERELETHVTCGRCTLDYSVYGLFAFCPDCGVHNSLQILEKNLILVRKQLALAASQPDDDLTPPDRRRLGKLRLILRRVRSGVMSNQRNHDRQPSARPICFLSKSCARSSPRRAGIRRRTATGFIA